MYDLARGQIPDSHVPFRDSVLPPTLKHLMRELDEPISRILLRRPFQIGLNLLGRSIQRGPVVVRFELRGESDGTPSM